MFSSLSYAKVNHKTTIIPSLRPQWGILAAIEVVAFLARFIGLGAYHGLIYDEYYYVTAADVLLHRKPPVLVPHLVYGIDPNLLSAPPFAKEVIAASIWLFGNHPWAWRLPGAFLGSLVPLVIYLFAMALFDNRWTAGIAAALSAVDGLMVSTSRVALLDSIAFPFVVFNLYWLWTIWARIRQDASVSRVTLWGFGISLGLGFSAKWIGAQTILMAWIVLAWSWRHVQRSPRRLLIALSVTIIPLVTYFLTYAYAFPSGFHQTWLPRNVFEAWGKLQWLILKNMWTLRFYHPWTANAWTWMLLPRPTAYLWITQAHATIRLLAFSNPLVIWLGLLGLMMLVVQDIRQHRTRPVTIFFVVWLFVFYGTWLLTPRSKFNYYFLSMMPMLIMALASGLMALWQLRTRFARAGSLLIIGALGISTAYLFPLWVGLAMPTGFYHRIIWSPTWNAKPKPVSHVPVPTSVSSFAAFGRWSTSVSVPSTWTAFEAGATHDTAWTWSKSEPLATGYVLHLNGAVVDQPAVVGHDAYAGSNGGAVVAWNLQTGKRLWSDVVPNMVMTTPLVTKSRVIVGLGNNAFREFSSRQGWIRGSGTNGVMALSRATGKELWFTPTHGEDMPTPVIQDGVVYEVTGGGRLIALNANNGHLMWSLFLGGFDSMSSPVIVGHILYVATNVYMKSYPATRSTVWAINVATRHIGWAKNIPVASGLSDCSPIVVKGILYIAGVPRIVNVTGGRTWLDNRLFALNARSGRILWSTITGGGYLGLDQEEEGIPFVHGGLVFIGNPAAKTLRAYNAVTGRLVWARSLPASLTANPVASGPYLWIGLHNGVVMEMQASSGTIVRSQQLGLGPIGPAAPIIFPRGFLMATLSGNIGMVPFAFGQ